MTVARQFQRKLRGFAATPSRLGSRVGITGACDTHRECLSYTTGRHFVGRCTNRWTHCRHPSLPWYAATRKRRRRPISTCGIQLTEGGDLEHSREWGGQTQITEGVKQVCRPKKTPLSFVWIMNERGPETASTPRRWHLERFSVQADGLAHAFFLSFASPPRTPSSSAPFREPLSFLNLFLFSCSSAREVVSWLRYPVLYPMSTKRGEETFCLEK